MDGVREGIKVDDIEQCVNRRPRPATIKDALENGALRVRLAFLEAEEAAKRADELKGQHDEAVRHAGRCREALLHAEKRLCHLAALGTVDAYCPIHDLYYKYEPGPSVKAERWTGAPPCPQCESSLDI